MSTFSELFPVAHQKLSKEAIAKFDETLESEFMAIMDFLHIEPEFASSLRGKGQPSFPSPAYIEKCAQKFVEGRKLPTLQWSDKTSDPLLSIALKTFLELDNSEINEAIEIHKKLMIIENKIGEILESYISMKSSSNGWVWCSGSIVKTVDFIRKTADGTYEILQIKNKDVSENSTSIKGRGKIPMWKRLKGKKAKSNWTSYPDNALEELMSERDFINFATKKLLEIKKAQEASDT